MGSETHANTAYVEEQDGWVVRLGVIWSHVEAIVEEDVGFVVAVPRSGHSYVSYIMAVCDWQVPNA